MLDSLPAFDKRTLPNAVLSVKDMYLLLVLHFGPIMAMATKERPLIYDPKNNLTRGKNDCRKATANFYKGIYRLLGKTSIRSDF